MGSAIQVAVEEQARPQPVTSPMRWSITCPYCGGKRKLIALLTDGAVVRRILEHLGLPTAAPTLAPARSPPGLEFAG
jgi:hypothetical protein